MNVNFRTPSQSSVQLNKTNRMPFKSILAIIGEKSTITKDQFEQRLAQDGVKIKWSNATTYFNGEYKFTGKHIGDIDTYKYHKQKEYDYIKKLNKEYEDDAVLCLDPEFGI